MPNWCSNQGSLTGDPEIIKFIWEQVKDKDKGLTVLHPCPEDLTNTMSGFMSEDSEGHDEWVAKQASNKEKYGYTDWYGWAVDNWGTKWAPDFDLQLSDDGTTIEFQGDSAWSPPTHLFINISKMFPSVLIDHSYIEEGMAFVGFSVYKGGNHYDSCGDIQAEYPWEEDFPDADAYDKAYDDYLTLHDSERDAHEAEAWRKYGAGEAEDHSGPSDYTMLEATVAFMTEEVSKKNAGVVGTIAKEIL
jgi:hypothetical protein